MSPSSEIKTEPTIESSISNLSIHSGEENWDQSMIVEPPTPTTIQSTDSSSDSAKKNGGGETGEKKFGTRGKRSLGEMLKRHVEKGRSLNLSDEDEENLSEELGKWINSDSSPYEIDDAYFKEDSTNMNRSRANTFDGKSKENSNTA